MSHTIKIVSRYYLTRVLYECDVTDEDRASGIGMRVALEKAARAGANLAGAYLARANLDGASLAGANLDGAYLDGSKVLRKVAQVRRDDGHEFIAFAMQDGRTIIRAGCRTMTPEKFREHVAKEYPGTPKASETLAIIDFIEARAIIAKATGEAA